MTNLTRRSRSKDSSGHPDGAIIADAIAWHAARRRAHELLLRKNEIEEVLPAEFKGIAINIEAEGSEKLLGSGKEKTRWERWTKFRRAVGIAAIYDELDGLWDKIDPIEDRLVKAAPTTLEGALAIVRVFMTNAYYLSIEQCEEECPSGGFKAGLTAL